MSAALIHIADPSVPGGWRPATAADFAGTGPVIQDVVSIASLAGSATATGTVIDLGATHATATVTCIKSAGASQADTVMLEQSDDGSYWIQVPRADSTPGNALAWSNASGINCVVIGRPSMRYVRAKIIGGAGAQPAGAQLVTAVHWGV